MHGNTRHFVVHEQPENLQIIFKYLFVLSYANVRLYLLEELLLYKSVELQTSSYILILTIHDDHIPNTCLDSNAMVRGSLESNRVESLRSEHIVTLALALSRKLRKLSHHGCSHDPIM